MSEVDSYKTNGLSLQCYAIWQVSIFTDSILESWADIFSSS